MRIGKTDGSYDRHDLSLSSEEVELLWSANLSNGEIIVLSSEQLGRWVRAGRDFLAQGDPLIALTYIEALDSLCERGLARYDDGNLYMLTVAGFKLARTMLAEERSQA